jgi:hypothetical protein
MSIQVVIDEGSLSRTLHVIESAAIFGDDLTPLGPVIYDQWFSPLEKEQFATQGGLSGGWSISEAYAKRKADLYGNLPIEQLPDHKLLSSLTDRQAEGAVYDVQRDYLAFGSDLPYAAKQNAQNTLIEVPPEKFLTLEELIAREWTSFIGAEAERI